MQDYSYMEQHTHENFETFSNYTIPDEALKDLLERKDQIHVFLDIKEPIKESDVGELKKTEEFFNKKGYYLAFSLEQQGGGYVMAFKRAEG